VELDLTGERFNMEATGGMVKESREQWTSGEEEEGEEEEKKKRRR
jgi:hypothetical protein